MAGEWGGPVIPEGDPSGWGGLTEALRLIRARIAALETRNPLQHASIGLGGLRVYGGGRLDFDSGGSIRMRDNAGRDFMYSGGFATNGFGFTLTRLNGVQALVFADDDPDNEAVQRIRLMDRNGKALVSEDSGGSGLSWPLVPIPFNGADWRQWHGNDTATFTEVRGATLYKPAPRFYLTVNHVGDSADTTGELRLLVNGVQQGATVPVGALAIGQTDFQTPAVLPGAVGDLVTLAVQARRTAGTGFIRAEVMLATTWAS